MNTDKILVEDTMSFEIEDNMTKSHIIALVQSLPENGWTEQRGYYEDAEWLWVYKRLETDAEFYKRRRAEAEKERRRLVKEQAEYKQYLELKAKWEGSQNNKT